MNGGQAIVFDLDGTLVDSVSDIAAAATEALSTFELRPIERDEAARFVGQGAASFVSRALAATGGDPALHDIALERFHDAYRRQGAKLSRLFPHVPEALSQLREDGARLGVCTNKPEPIARAVLREMDLSAFFAVVVGAEEGRPLKPDPASLLACFDALGGDERLYVGDSETDAETAAAAGVRFALFTEGYRHTPAEEIAAAFRFDDFMKLPDLALDAGSGAATS